MNIPEMALGKLEQLTVKPDAIGDDRQRRVFLALSVLVFAPVVSLFGIQDLIAGRMVEGAAVLALVVALSLSLIVVRRSEDIRWGYRLVTVAVMALLGFELAIGGGQGLGFLWFYFIPVGLYYVFGLREGSVWVAVSVLLAVPLLLTDLGFVYPTEWGIRFLVTYLVVAVPAFGLERSRAHLFSSLESEKLQLEIALSKVKTLTGMLPICSSCMKIRDDDGYWTLIETYLEEHSDAVFSHSLCPYCMEKRFPEEVARIRERERAEEE